MLAFLAGRSGKVVGKTQLLTAVWGYDDYAANLVEVHVSALRRKLEAHGPRLLHTMWTYTHVCSTQLRLRE